jgi:hypothetical protein
MMSIKEDNYLFIFFEVYSMKQMLLKCLAATGIALLISPAFAADSIKPTFQISIQPIGPAEAAAAVETPVTISKALRAKALYSN